MKRQRAMYQMKEQEKTPEKQLNEVEIGNLPEKEFRIMIVKMMQDLGKRMEAKIEKMQEMFNKDLGLSALFHPIPPLSSTSQAPPPAQPPLWHP